MIHTRLIAALMLAALLAACGTAPQPGAQQPAATAAQPAATAAQPAATDAPQPAATAAPEAAATAAPEAAAPKAGGSVTRAITTEPTGLDPAGAQGSG